MARGRHPTRIHIQPPDPQTAQRYLLYWGGAQLRNAPHSFPVLTSQALFGNDRPLEIDWGCGTGTLVCNRARLFPEINFIGIDLSQKPLFCAVQEASRDRLDNIRFIRGDMTLLTARLSPATIPTMYYLFPNPPLDYARERANHNRRAFFNALYLALAYGGALYCATDAPLFYQCLSAVLKDDLGLNPCPIDIAEMEFNTRYHYIWQDRGKKVACLVVKKEAEGIHQPVREGAPAP